jgi:hypothetical protein
MELTDDVVYNKDATGCRLFVPKRIAEIRLCGGAMVFYIDETTQFTMPTEEQRKNLKEMLCIEVIPYEENI